MSIEDIHCEIDAGVYKVQKQLYIRQHSHDVPATHRRKYSSLHDLDKLPNDLDTSTANARIRTLSESEIQEDQSCTFLHENGISSSVSDHSNINVEDKQSVKSISRSPACLSCIWTKMKKTSLGSLVR